MGHRQLDAGKGPRRRHGRLYRRARFRRRDAAPKGQALSLFELGLSCRRRGLARGAGPAGGVRGGAGGVAAEQHEEFPVRFRFRNLFGMAPDCV